MGPHTLIKCLISHCGTLLLIKGIDKAQTSPRFAELEENNEKIWTNVIPSDWGTDIILGGFVASSWTFPPSGNVSLDGTYHKLTD